MRRRPRRPSTPLVLVLVACYQATVTARPSTTLLLWSLSLVLGGQALLVLLHSLLGRSTHGPPMALLVVTAGAELLGALLLFVPQKRSLGGYLLLASLGLAMVLHVAMGEWPPAAYLVYAAAIRVVIRGDRSPAPRGAG